jgi:hypothetical protein
MISAPFAVAVDSVTKSSTANAKSVLTVATNPQNRCAQ